jgi:biopolymer transport protein ExbD
MTDRFRFDALLGAAYPIAASVPALAVLLWISWAPQVCEGFRVRLPEVSDADFLFDGRFVGWIRVSPDGSALDGKPVSPDLLARRLRAKRRVHPDFRLLISADRREPYANVRSVLRAAQDAGISAVTLEVEAPRLKHLRLR